MNTLLLQLLDWFFVVFHTALILFNILGWLVPRLRKLNLICLLLTGGSWFVLGLFYGIGYCPLTDWHWAVLKGLSETGLPASYIQYMLERLTGIIVTASQADLMTGAGYFIALAASIFVNVWAYLRRK